MRLSVTARAILVALPGVAVGIGWVLISALRAASFSAPSESLGSDGVGVGVPIVETVSYVFDVRTTPLVAAGVGAVIAGMSVGWFLRGRGRAACGSATAFLLAVATGLVLVARRHTIVWDSVPLGWAITLFLSLAVLYAFGALLVDLWHRRRRSLGEPSASSPSGAGHERSASRLRWVTGWAVLATAPAAVVLAMWFNALFDGVLWGDDAPSSVVDQFAGNETSAWYPVAEHEGTRLHFWWVLVFLFFVGVTVAAALARWGWRAWLVSATVLAAVAGVLGLAVWMAPIDWAISGHISFVWASAAPVFVVAAGAAVSDAWRWRVRRRAA